MRVFNCTRTNLTVFIPIKTSGTEVISCRASTLVFVLICYSTLPCHPNSFCRAPQISPALISTVLLQLYQVAYLQWLGGHELAVNTCVIGKARKLTSCARGGEGTACSGFHDCAGSGTDSGNTTTFTPRLPLDESTFQTKQDKNIW